MGLYSFLKYIYKGHVTNWIWRDRSLRRRIRKDARVGMHFSYLKKYIPFIKNLTPPPPPDKDDCTSHRIFILWLQGYENAPFLVRCCIDSIRDRYHDRVILLDEKNLDSFIQLPHYIANMWKERKMLPAHYADIIRIELLYRYGGYWFDATDLMIGEIPELIQEQSFFTYLPFPVMEEIPFIENYFIRAKKGDPLLSMWRNLIFEYWKHENKARGYFLVQSLFKLLVTNNPVANKLFNDMPRLNRDGTLLLWHRYKDTPYSRDIYEKFLQESFFQKCAYKRKNRKEKPYIEGSMLDVLLKTGGYGKS